VPLLARKREERTLNFSQRLPFPHFLAHTCAPFLLHAITLRAACAWATGSASEFLRRGDYPSMLCLPLKFSHARDCRGMDVNIRRAPMTAGNIPVTRPRALASRHAACLPSTRKTYYIFNNTRTVHCSVLARSMPAGRALCIAVATPATPPCGTVCR